MATALILLRFRRLLAAQILDELVCGILPLRQVECMRPDLRQIYGRQMYTFTFGTHYAQAVYWDVGRIRVQYLA